MHLGDDDGKKSNFYMLNCVRPYFCCSKYPSSGVPVSGMDDLDVKGFDAVWNFGDRIYCRLAIEVAET
jgi:hypothetical protein